MTKWMCCYRRSNYSIIELFFPPLPLPVVLSDAPKIQVVTAVSQNNKSSDASESHQKPQPPSELLMCVTKCYQIVLFIYIVFQGNYIVLHVSCECHLVRPLWFLSTNASLYSKSAHFIHFFKCRLSLSTFRVSFNQTASFDVMSQQVWGIFAQDHSCL